MTGKVGGVDRDQQFDQLLKWRSLPYGKFCACVLCGRDREGDEEKVTWNGKVLYGKPMYLYGYSPELCICFRCFVERGCTAPKQDPRAAAENGAKRRTTSNAIAEPSDDQRDVIAQIMSLREQGHGYPRIAAALNDAGIATFGKPGARWHGPTVRNIVLKQQGVEAVAA